jgi:hypothetical protein
MISQRNGYDFWPEPASALRSDYVHHAELWANEGGLQGDELKKNRAGCYEHPTP